MNPLPQGRSCARAGGVCTTPRVCECRPCASPQVIFFTGVLPRVQIFDFNLLWAWFFSSPQLIPSEISLHGVDLRSFLMSRGPEVNPKRLRVGWNWKWGWVWLGLGSTTTILLQGCPTSQCNAIRCNMPYNAMQGNARQGNAMQCNAMHGQGQSWWSFLIHETKWFTPDPPALCRLYATVL